MPSMFSRHPAHRITYLFKEMFSEIVEADPNVEVGVAIAAAAERSGMPEYSIEVIGERLMKIAEQIQKRSEAKPAGPVKEGSGFGKGFTKWASELSPEKLCLWLADYDLSRARSLYCDTDIEDLSVMVDLKTGQVWQDMRTRFEACVLGFGGKLEGQTDATVHQVNLNDNTSVQDMIQQMKSMGF